MVVDKNFGTVPYLIKKYENVSFYEWQDVRENGNKKNEIVRLHAKIIQFEFDKKTYLLSGSSNATTEAFGSLNKNTRNAEANILILSEKKTDWIKNLKINLLDKNEFEISSFNNEKNEIKETEYKSFSIKILNSEVDENQLIIYTKEIEDLKIDYQVEIEKINGEKSYYNRYEKSDNNITLFIADEDIKGFRVCLVDSKRNRVSTFSKIVDKQIILRTNPDIKSNKIFQILNGTELTNSDLKQLLEFANFENHNFRNGSKKMYDLNESKKDDDGEKKEYNKLTEDQFNQNDNIIERKNYNDKRNLTLLEEFLNQMTFGELKNKDFDDSEERMAELAGQEGLPNSDVEVGKEVKLSFSDGQKLKNILHSTLNKINSAILPKHQQLIKSIINSNSIKQIPSIEDIKALLVGTHLIFMKINERFVEERSRIIINYSNIDDLKSLRILKD